MKYVTNDVFSSSHLMIKKSSFGLVCIKYEHEKDEIPIVVAKYSQEFLNDGDRFANEHKLVVLEHDRIFDFAYNNLNIGDTIPKELYEDIAEMFVLSKAINSNLRN